jgi:CdiI immunity protein
VRRSAAERYPHLARLCGAYLHEDFDIDGSTAEQAVRRFARDLPAARVAAARGDLERLLAAVRTETGLARALTALGCAYRPQRPLRRWLKRLVQLLG